MQDFNFRCTASQCLSWLMFSIYNVKNTWSYAGPLHSEKVNNNNIITKATRNAPTDCIKN